MHRNCFLPVDSSVGFLNCCDFFLISGSKNYFQPVLPYRFWSICDAVMFMPVTVWGFHGQEMQDFQMMQQMPGVANFVGPTNNHGPNWTFWPGNTKFSQERR